MASGATLTRSADAVQPAAVTGKLLPSGDACGQPLDNGEESAPPQGNCQTFLGTTLRKIRDVSILLLPSANEATSNPSSMSPSPNARTSGCATACC